MDACLNRASGSAILGENKMFTFITVTLLRANMSSVSRQVGFWAALGGSPPPASRVHVWWTVRVCFSAHGSVPRGRKALATGLSLTHTHRSHERAHTSRGRESVCVCARKHGKARNKMVPGSPHIERDMRNAEVPPHNNV